MGTGTALNQKGRTPGIRPLMRNLVTEFCLDGLHSSIQYPILLAQSILRSKRHRDIRYDALPFDDDFTR